MFFFFLQSNHFHNKLNEILDMVSRPPDSPEASRKSLEETSGPVFEMQFPDLFVYWVQPNIIANVILFKSFRKHDMIMNKVCRNFRLESTGTCMELSASVLFD